MLDFGKIVNFLFLDFIVALFDEAIASYMMYD